MEQNTFTLLDRMLPVCFPLSSVNVVLNLESRTAQITHFRACTYRPVLVPIDELTEGLQSYRNNKKVRDTVAEAHILYLLR